MQKAWIRAPYQKWPKKMPGALTHPLSPTLSANPPPPPTPPDTNVEWQACVHTHQPSLEAMDSHNTTAAHQYVWKQSHRRAPAPDVQ